MSMSHPVLNVWVRNRGDRMTHVGWVTLHLSTDAAAAVGEGAARRGSDPGNPA